MAFLDSSSLILFAKSDVLDIFIDSLVEKPKITEIVFEECIKKDSLDAKLIKQRVLGKKITVVKASDRQLCNKIAIDFNLGLGEAETIGQAIKENSSVITDDKKAMKVCRIFNLEFTSTLSLLSVLYENKKIDKSEALSAFEKLRKHGWFSKEVLNKFLEDLT
ncbi:MAG: hypothetical protein Q7K42_04285 [Candidatus Diapherotrites archaeon]|nr:hypothetical protein [Candidatus Diapherotrites archaeon]